MPFELILSGRFVVGRPPFSFAPAAKNLAAAGQGVPVSSSLRTMGPARPRLPTGRMSSSSLESTSTSSCTRPPFSASRAYTASQSSSSAGFSASSAAKTVAHRKRLRAERPSRVLLMTRSIRSLTLRCLFGGGEASGLPGLHVAVRLVFLGRVVGAAAADPPTPALFRTAPGRSRGRLLLAGPAARPPVVFTSQAAPAAPDRDAPGRGSRIRLRAAARLGFLHSPPLLALAFKLPYLCLESTHVFSLPGCPFRLAAKSTSPVVAKSLQAEQCAT